MRVSDAIEKLIPYSPGKPIEETQREFGLDQVYKLASNENPMGVSEKVMEAVKRASMEIHRYPDASCYKMRQAVADYWSVDAARLCFGNGSNELIDLLIRIFCEPGDSVVTSDFAFIAYKICAQAARVKLHSSKMNMDSLTIDLEAMSQLIDGLDSPPKLIFLPNPNNPTGTYIKESELEKFISKYSDNNKTLVVLDEAYFEFVRAKDYPDGMKLVDKYPGVIAMRTFSKVFGLAGLRVGALYGSTEVIDYIDRVRNPFNVNSIAQEAVIAALSDKTFLQKVCENNWQGLDYFYQELEAMGVRFWPSEANFVLVDCVKPGPEVYAELLKQGLIVRPVAGYGLGHHLRISVGLPEENEVAMRLLKSALC